jgi:hypothetical protein
MIVRSSRKPRRTLPPLENGDRLDQKTFHERYEAMPPDVHAELIGGIVYMASPQRKRHGVSQATILWWLGHYSIATPGTEVMANPTSILGPDSEPEPDSCLAILPEYGGQTEEKKGYVFGAPELSAEVAWSSESIDLHTKKDDYEKAGVREYIVAAIRQQQVFWFLRKRGKFRDLPPGADGVFRSEVFPGLWLDPVAFLTSDRKHLLAVLQQGLASPEHAAFVAKLAANRP